MTNDSGQWRHFAVDTVRDLVYFCDYNPKTDDMSCFSGDPNSNIWTGAFFLSSFFSVFQRNHSSRDSRTKGRDSNYEKVRVTNVARTQ